MSKHKGHPPSPEAAENPSEMPGAHQWVARAKLVAIIALRVRAKGDSIREARDKVGKRITYAHTEQKTLARPVGGKFVFGDVVRWARQIPEWREQLDGLPETDPPKKPPVRVRAGHEVAYDLSLKECHELLAEATEQLQAAFEELKRLRPLAERWRALVKKNTDNAKKKKGGGVK